MINIQHPEIHDRNLRSRIYADLIHEANHKFGRNHLSLARRG